MQDLLCHFRVSPLEKEEGADVCFLVLPLPLNNWVLQNKPVSSQGLHLPICEIARLGPVFFEAPSSLGCLEGHLWAVPLRGLHDPM